MVRPSVYKPGAALGLDWSVHPRSADGAACGRADREHFDVIVRGQLVAWDSRGRRAWSEVEELQDLDVVLGDSQFTPWPVKVEVTCGYVEEESIFRKGPALATTPVFVAIGGRGPFRRGVLRQPRCVPPDRRS